VIYLEIFTKLINWLKLQKLKKEKAFFDSGAGWITSIEFAKFEEPVLVFYKDEFLDSSANIYLRSVHRGKIHRSSILLSFSGDVMTIGDVRVLENNRLSGKYSRGYGSILMKIALEEAKHRRIKTVTGNMVGNDPGQRERQINYYSKFGFTIDSNNKLHLDL
jgi:hypothetical protein